jgi:hypothetical protein
MMDDMVPSHKVVRFGDFEADLKAGCLFKRGVKIRLPEKVSVALSVLLERAGDVVVYFDLNLNTVIAKLREGDRSSMMRACSGGNHPGNAFEAQEA